MEVKRQAKSKAEKIDRTARKRNDRMVKGNIFTWKNEGKSNGFLKSHISLRCVVMTSESASKPCYCGGAKGEDWARVRLEANICAHTHMYTHMCTHMYTCTCINTYKHVHTYTSHYTNRKALSKFLRRVDGFFYEKTLEWFKSVEEFVPRPRGGLLLNFKIRKDF